jgi:hypothetical protein
MRARGWLVPRGCRRRGGRHVAATPCRAAGAVSVMAVTAISMTDAVQPDQLTADEIRRLMMGTLHQERLVRSDGPYEEVCGRAATRKPIT